MLKKISLGTIELLNDNILVGLEVKEVKSKSGLILGKTNDQEVERDSKGMYKLKHYVAKVLDSTREEIKKDEFVVYGQLAGTRVLSHSDYIFEFIKWHNVSIVCSDENISNPRVVFNRILVKLKKTSERIENGIILPESEFVESDNRMHDSGEVVSVSDEARAIGINEGDMIYWEYGIGANMELLETAEYTFRTIDYRDVIFRTK